MRRDRPRRRTGLKGTKPLSRAKLIGDTRERLPLNDNESSETMNEPSHKRTVPEAEEISGFDGVSVPSESGERLVTDQKREEIEGVLLAEGIAPEAGEHAVFTSIEATTRPDQPHHFRHSSDLPESVLEAKLQKVGRLLQENTLEAHEEAFKLLRDCQVTATQRYEDIHTNLNPEEKHRFSEVSPGLVNPFARTVLETLDLNDRSLIYVLGSGYGNDDLYFARNSRAHVAGVDNSKTAITSARGYQDVMDKECDLEWIEDSLRGIAGKHEQSYDKTHKILLDMAAENTCIAKRVRARRSIGPMEYRKKVAEAVGFMNSSKDRIQFDHDDYVHVLDSSRGMGIDLIYSHSTLHYFPPLVLKERIFPMIAKALKKGDGTVVGKFCLAMKLTSSASALSVNQIKLAPGHPYDPSYDKVDELFRIYLASEEEMLALAEPTFDVASINVVPHHNYDKTGNTEILCQAILIPKAA